MFSSVTNDSSEKHTGWPFLDEFKISVEKAVHILSNKDKIVLLTREVGLRHEFVMTPSIVLKEEKARLFIKGVMPVIVYESRHGISSVISKTVSLSNEVRLASQDDKNEYYIDLCEEFTATVNALISHFNAPTNLKAGDTPIAIAVDPENEMSCIIYSRDFSHFESSIPSSIKRELITQHFSVQKPLDTTLIQTLGIEDEIKSIQAILDSVK